MEKLWDYEFLFSDNLNISNKLGKTERYRRYQKELSLQWDWKKFVTLPHAV